MSRGGRALALGLGAIGAVALLLGLAFAQAAREGARAMAASDAALGQKRLDVAIAEASLAASYRAPLSPWAERGHARLKALGAQAEARGDDAIAEAAWRGVYAAEASAGPFTANAERRAEATRALARVGARRALVQAARAPGLPHPEEAALEAAYARSPRPSSGALALLAIGAMVAGAAAYELSRGTSLASRRARIVAGALALGALSVAAALAR